MNIERINQIHFTEDVLTATVANDNEILVLTSSAQVCRYQIKEQLCEPLFSVKSSVGYDDGGFDITDQATIYALDDIVVIVNDYKRHGFIHYPGKYDRLHLWRGEYYADISCFPIALFNNEQGVPHLIYGSDWNHLQIMNLDTRQVVTADKSLIEENAEEIHLDFYKNHEEHNKLAWPRPYDYFYGKLSLSPDKKMFLSSGWFWGSYDDYKAYDIEHFINHHRISDIPIFTGEHMQRAACWVSENSVAVALNPYNEGEDDTTKDSPCEIYYYRICDGKSELERNAVILKLDVVNMEFNYNKLLNVIVATSPKTGVTVLSLEGEILFQDTHLQVNGYNAQENLLFQLKDRSLVLYQIKNHRK